MLTFKVGKSIEDINKSSKTEKQLIERDQAEEKSVKKLEDNLDCEIKKYNSVVADNARLREEISHLIRERLNTIYYYLFSLQLII